MPASRLLPLLAAIALLGCLAAGAPLASAAKKPTCMKVKGKTVAISTSARLFTTRGGTVLYGCMKGKRPRKLATSTDDDFVTSETFISPTLAGSYAAYGFQSVDMSCKANCPPDYDDTTESVIVVNLITGRSASASAWNGEPFVLTATGAVAWISGSGSAPRVVNALFQGTVTKQDEGAIADNSLEASRSRVTWIKDGKVTGAFFG